MTLCLKSSITKRMTRNEVASALYSYNKADDEISLGTSLNRMYKASVRATGVTVIIKQIMNGAAEETFFAACNREIIGLRNLSHPGIPRVLNSFTDDEDHHLFVVCEYSPSTTLATKFKSATLTPIESVGLFIDVVSVLDYIHARGVIHHDIRPDNILWPITYSGNIQLTNFGSAVFESSGGMSVKVMTPFASPEILQLRGHPLYEDPTAAAVASDIWSFVATLLTVSTDAYVIHSGAAGNEDHHQRLKDGSWDFQENVVDAFNDEQRARWEGLPTELRSLLERCLVLNKDDRPTASQILESNEFSDLRQLFRLDHTAADATDSTNGGRVRLLSSLSEDEVVYLISKALNVPASSIETSIKAHNIDGDMLSAVEDISELTFLDLLPLKQRKLFKLITETWKVDGVSAEDLPEVVTPKVLERRAREQEEAERLEVERMELEARKRAASGSRWSIYFRASVLAFQTAGDVGGVLAVLRDVGLEDPDVALQVCRDLVRCRLTLL